MQIFSPDGHSDDIARQAFWLAYQASRSAGFSFLRTKENASKEEVIAEIVGTKEAGSVPMLTGRVHADHIFGRKIKLTIEIVDKNTLEVTDYTPTLEYQSWADRFPSHEALFGQAASDLSLIIIASSAWRSVLYDADADADDADEEGGQLDIFAGVEEDDEDNTDDDDADSELDAPAPAEVCPDSEVDDDEDEGFDGDLNDDEAYDDDDDDDYDGNDDDYDEDDYPL